MADLQLMHNFSVANKIRKNVSVIATDSGASFEPTDDFDIRLRCHRSSLGKDINYFTWDGAYYFLKSVERDTNSIMYINGDMDLLMTYADAIMGLHGKASRSTSHGSSRLSDDLRNISVDTERTVVDFPVPIEDDEEHGTYILVTSQGGFPH